MMPYDLIHKIRSCNHTPGDTHYIYVLCFQRTGLKGSNRTGVWCLGLQSNQFLFIPETLLLAVPSLFLYLSLERKADQTYSKSLKEGLIKCASRLQSLQCTTILCHLNKQKVLIWVLDISMPCTPSLTTVLRAAMPFQTSAQLFCASPLGTAFSNLANVCAHYPSIISCTVLDMLFHLSL